MRDTSPQEDKHTRKKRTIQKFSTTTNNTRRKSPKNKAERRPKAKSQKTARKVRKRKASQIDELTNKREKNKK